MKSLDFLSKLKREGKFEVLELPGCHTQAKSMDQLLERTKEAIKAYLQEDKEVDSSENFIGVQQIEV